MGRGRCRCRCGLLLLVVLLVGCGGSKAQLTAPPDTIRAPVGATSALLRPSPTAPRPVSTAVAAPSDVPTKAYETLRYVESHNGNPPPGYAGGTTFENRERRLPLGHYKEYDVDPRASGGRNADRLVIDQDNGRAYYTSDHYDTFIPLSSGR
ncbi:MAG: ribonuclease [Chloroflexota bacterium]|nr:ribonuclease [Chloroflexota bacterium]